MEIDAEMRRKIVVSVVAVGIFVGLILGVTTAFNGDGGLGSQGGLYLIGSIVLFVLGMAGVGIWLDR